MNKQVQNGFKTPDKSSQKLSQYNGKCVCQICTCGKDKCPPQQLHVNPSHFDTTNRKSYVKWDIKKTKPIVPEQYRINLGTQSFVSSYQRDYTPQKTPERQTRKTQETTIPFHRPFISSTEYNQKYQPYDTMAVSMKPQYFYQENPNKLQTSTTYSENFKVQPISNQYQIKHHDQSFTPTKVQFNANSKYQEDYTAQKGSRATPIKHNNQSPFGGVNFEKFSSYQKDYQQLDEDTYKKPQCPIRMLPVPDRSKSPNKHLMFSAQKNDWE
ncbi:unnamed protein product [Paramecium sonneborni]|uniref:STOP protein n=1 Tax=Paramecium sonneborni TaxID=65129 RepID=A0A8S1KXS9_9CILI|nr:unnamed protein product [Paramecium sonneborni]